MMGQTVISEQQNGDASAVWRLEKGFDPEFEQHTPVQLSVVGCIPTYAAGVLYRTGPGGRKVAGPDNKILSMNHWFDGFTQVHRFKIDPTGDAASPVRVTYNSRMVVDELLEKMRKTGNLDDFTFAQKRYPCESLFQKAMSTFRAATASGEPVGISSQNVGVTLSVDMPGFQTISRGEKPSVGSHSSSIRTLHTKTDANIFQQIDPETLEPLGLARQTALHPDLKGPLSAAHAKFDPDTGDMFNYNLDFGMNPTYRVFYTSAATGRTTILATIHDKPAYLHSLFISGSYVILCVWNSHYTKGGATMLYHKNVLDAIAPYDASQKAKWYVVDRLNGRGVVATYESDPFFCFHTINAWERPSSTDPANVEIVADFSRHENLDILHALFLKNLLSKEPTRKSMQPTVCRFVLPDVPVSGSRAEVKQAELVFDTIKDLGAELPIINPKFATKEARFVYGIANRGRSTICDGLIKLDLRTQEAVYWEKWSHTPGEPIFVGNPEGTDEDDGVLLSVVLDGKLEKSYLLCLDARTMKELGKAEVDGAVGFGFHGRHVRLLV